MDAATGKPAFPGVEREEIAHRIRTAPPELHDIEDPLRTVVRACLQKRADRRPTAAQARRMLLGPPRSPGPAGRTAVRPPGNPTRRAAQPEPTRVAPPAPPAPVAATAGTGAWKGAAALAAAVAAAVAIALIWAIPRGSGKDDAGASVLSAVPSDTTPSGSPGLLAAYEKFWPDAPCTPVKPSSSQLVRDQCPITRDGVKLLLFCILYDGMDAMTASGRPGGLANNITDIGWDNEWYRTDSGIHGKFIAYRLDHDRSGIWWEDSADPVACMIHGPPDTASTLVAAFTGHGFVLRTPAPSGS